LKEETHISSVAELDPKGDVAPTPARTALALNIMFKIDRLSKISQTVTVSYFSH
jgi:hypothetical protein